MPPPALATPAAKASALAHADERAEEELREAILLASLATHPNLIARLESALERLHMSGPGHEGLRDALLRAAHDGLLDDIAPELFRKKITGTEAEVLERLLHLPHVRSAPTVIKTRDHDLAQKVIEQDLSFLSARRAARAEIEEAMEDLQGLADEGLTWRLDQANRAKHDAASAKLHGDNDLGSDDASLSARLQRMIDEQIWQKKRH
jgi:DNA primase